MGSPHYRSLRIVLAVHLHSREVCPRRSRVVWWRHARVLGQIHAGQRSSEEPRQGIETRFLDGPSIFSPSCSRKTFWLLCFSKSLPSGSFDPELLAQRPQPTNLTTGSVCRKLSPHWQRSGYMIELAGLAEKSLSERPPKPKPRLRDPSPAKGRS